MQLSTEHLTAHIDDAKIMGYGSQSDTVIIDWDNDSVNVNVPLYAEDISCNNLTAAGDAVFTGTATFSNVIQGCSLCAQWADLAELYRSDADYEPGTLVKFGGEFEITVADETANAVITDKPGLILNGGQADGIYKGIALVGRTPVKVIGPVRKFDRLMADPQHPGFAKTAISGADAVAVALGDMPTEHAGAVECAVKMAL